MTAPDAPLTAEEQQLLPPLLRLVAQAAGVAAALAFAGKYGGVVVYVPVQPRPDHELAGVVSLAGLQALCEAYPGQPVQVPKGLRALLAIRNRRMREERQSASIRTLALAYGLDRRRVYQVMAEPCGQLGDDTPDLFT